MSFKEEMTTDEVEEMMAPMRWWELFECLAGASFLSGAYIPTSWLLLDLFFFGKNDPGRLLNVSGESWMMFWICGSVFILSFWFLLARVAIRKRKMRAFNTDTAA